MRSGSPENQAAELHLGSGHGSKATRSEPALVALELPTAQVACYKLQNLSSSEQLQSDEIWLQSRRFGPAQSLGDPSTIPKRRDRSQISSLWKPRAKVACYRISLPVSSPKATRSGSDLVALEVPRPKKPLQPKTYRRKAQEVLTDEKPKKS